MAIPYITLALIPHFSGNLDITAATGGENGNTGADWNTCKVGSHYDKMDGGYTLHEKLSPNFGYYFTPQTLDWNGNTISWTDEEYVQQPVSGSLYDGQGYVWGSDNNQSFVYIEPPADQLARTVRWYMTKWGFACTITATLSDGSAPPQSIVIPASSSGEFYTQSNCSIQCDYRGADPAGKITIQLQKTATSPDAGVLYSKCRLALPPVKPKRARTANHG